MQDLVKSKDATSVAPHLRRANDAAVEVDDSRRGNATFVIGCKELAVFLACFYPSAGMGRIIALLLELRGGYFFKANRHRCLPLLFRKHDVIVKFSYLADVDFSVRFYR
jgi:hypothetical protein